MRILHIDTSLGIESACFTMAAGGCSRGGGPIRPRRPPTTAASLQANKPRSSSSGRAGGAWSGGVAGVPNTRLLRRATQRVQLADRRRVRHEGRCDRALWILWRGDGGCGAIPAQRMEQPAEARRGERLRRRGCRRRRRRIAPQPLAAVRSGRNLPPQRGLRREKCGLLSASAQPPFTLSRRGSTTRQHSFYSTSALSPQHVTAGLTAPRRAALHVLELPGLLRLRLVIHHPCFS